MIILTCWVVFAALLAWVASERGRSGLGWFLIALVASPLLGALLLIALPVRREMAAPAPQFAAVAPARVPVSAPGPGTGAPPAGRLLAWGAVAALAICIPAWILIARSVNATTSTSHVAAERPGVSKAALVNFARDGAVALRKTRTNPSDLRLVSVRVSTTPGGRGVACYEYARRTSPSDSDNPFWGSIRVGSEYFDLSEGERYLREDSRFCESGAGVDVTKDVVAALAKSSHATS